MSMREQSVATWALRRFAISGMVEDLTSQGGVVIYPSMIKTILVGAGHHHANRQPPNSGGSVLRA